jgi:hypothetical protein
LITWLDERHGWASESELALHYLAALRVGLDGEIGDGSGT